MESSQIGANPHAPIFVLGKQDDYLHVISTVEHTIEHTRRHLAAGLSLDMLEFFDAAGRRLRPVGEYGQLDGLEVDDPREHLRQRVITMLSVVDQDALSVSGLSDLNGDFEELTARLASLPVPDDPDHFEVPSAIPGAAIVISGSPLGNWCRQLHIC
ncbi:MAG: hypothetical protein ACRD0K_00020 [Egibacteraceae bacterium]